MEFHVTNTFLQTFILTCVGYFSYYFDVDNFTDRIMVVLTTMLVVATITTSIQTVSKLMIIYKSCNQNKNDIFRHRESNPGLLGESQLS